jgi:hypothetical protein
MNETAYLELIVVEVGDNEQNTLRQIAPTLWVLYSDKVPTHLRYLYTKRHAVEFLMGYYRDKVTFAGMNSSFQIAEKMTNLKTMWDLVNFEIQKRENESSANRTPLSGQLTNVVPIEKPDNYSYDANDRALRGDAYKLPLLSEPF